jgi:hypothetical protein
VEPITQVVGVFAVLLTDVLAITALHSSKFILTHAVIVEEVLRGLYSPPKSRFVRNVVLLANPHFPSMPVVFMVGER